MYKIKIMPPIKEENIKTFLKEIKSNKLLGCIEEFGYFDFPIKLRDVSHRILEIIIVGEEMSAIIEFLDTKLGNHMRSIVNGLGDDKFYLKENFLDENNLVLNICPIVKINKGVVL